MKRMFAISGSLLLSGLVAGCGQLPRTTGGPDIHANVAGPDSPRPVARPGRAVPVVPQGARTAEAFDTTTPAERAAALATASVGSREIGRTVASLGAPAEPGFWLRTSLVDAATPGRVTVRASGASVAVELRPSGAAAGSGSQLSLAAFRALDLPLTGLPELTVFAER